MINLKDTTFIIPIQVESEDRYNNAKVVLGYLNHHLDTNVFIYEKSDTYKSKLDFLDKLPNLNIKYFLEKNNDNFFHRTKFLNKMLRDVITPVVCNYDIDVMVILENYLRCQNYILNNELDMIYPYSEGHYQYQIHKTLSKEEFSNTEYNIDFINNSDKKNVHTSLYGHCMFFKTDIYKKYGAEEIAFRSYGAEDIFRYHKFINLCRVGRVKNSWVYHWEHSRNEHSSPSNPYFNDNEEIFKKLMEMPLEELKRYCLEREIK